MLIKDHDKLKNIGENAFYDVFGLCFNKRFNFL